MVKKYGLIGTILSISILLALVILGPSAVAVTPIDGGDLLSQVQAPGCITVAVATGVGDHDEWFYSNPVNVSVDWTLDNQCAHEGYHGFYLNVTNLNTTQTDDDEEYFGYGAGPQYHTGTMYAEVNGNIGNRIEIYIYVNVTYGLSFDEDDDTAVITLK